jgi:phosphate-selective porin OprO/OprP
VIGIPRGSLPPLVLSLVAAMSLGAQSAPPSAPTSSPASRTDDERGSIDLAFGDDMRLSMGGYLQVDGRWASGPQSRAPDGLLLRRARLVFDASRADGWHVRLQPDFGQGRVLVQDAFVGWRDRGTTVRLGRFRPAYGTERMQSSSTLLFPERSIVNTLMPSRSMGAQVTHQLGHVTVAAGAFRTPIGSDIPVVDTDGDVRATNGVGYDLLGRANWRVVRGARYADVQGSLLAGQERGTAENPAVARLLSVGQLPLVVFRDGATEATTVIADGARGRWSLGGVLGTARTMVGVERAQHWQQLRFAAARQQVQATAWSLRAATAWGGARNANQEITPQHRRGALELGVRAGQLQLDTPAGVPLLADGSRPLVRTSGAAVGWIPTVSTRLSVALDVTWPGFGGYTERVAVMRWQQGF